MLDQNTDRMWYVIGAVLIGAAIIFAGSMLFPSAFASVGGMFETVTDKVGDVEFNKRLESIDNIEPDGVNLLSEQMITSFVTTSFNADGYDSHGSVQFGTDDHMLSGIRLMFEDYSRLEPNSVYTLSYRLELIDGDLENVGGHVSAQFRPYQSYINGARYVYHDSYNYVADGSIVYDVVVHFFTPEVIDMATIDDRGVWIQPNRKVTGKRVSVEVSNLRIERGLVEVN